jgi:hypothetical protein
MNNKKILAIIISVLLVVLAQSAAFAGSKEYLDQSQTEDNGAYKLINSAQLVAQTFQPGINGKATSIAIKLNKISGTSTDGAPVYPGDLIVEIRPSSDSRGFPSEEVIASATIDEIQIEEDEPQWYEVNFTAPPYLKKKSIYAIVLKTAQVSDDPYDESIGSYALYHTGSDDYDPYVSGHLMGRRPTASWEHWYCWYPWRYNDCAFEIYMTKGKN